MENRVGDGGVSNNDHNNNNSSSSIQQQQLSSSHHEEEPQQTNIIDNHSTDHHLTNNNNFTSNPPQHQQTTATATSGSNPSNNKSSSKSSSQSSSSSFAPLEIELEEYNNGADNHQHNQHSSSSSSSSNSSNSNNQQQQLLKQLQAENEELKKIIQQHFQYYPTISINNTNNNNSHHPQQRPEQLLSSSKSRDRESKTTILGNSQLTYRSHVNDSSSKANEIPAAITTSQVISTTTTDNSNAAALNTIQPTTATTTTTNSATNRSKKHWKLPTRSQIFKTLQSLLFLYMSYLSHNFREIRKRKLAYLLGVGSCVLVVIVVCIALSVLQQVPIIFLRLAENTQFESDVVLTTNTNSPTKLFNVTQVQQNLVSAVGEREFTEQYSYFSPRIQWSGNVYPTQSCSAATVENSTTLNFNISTIEDYSKIAWFYNNTLSNSQSQSCSSHCVPKYCSSSYKTSIYILDFAGEKRMEFGRSFDKGYLKENEIYISQALAENLDLKRNDLILLQVNISDIINVMSNYEHELSNITSQTTSNQMRVVNEMIVDNHRYVVYVPFKIIDIFHTNYRKMEYSINNYIFIDYNNFLKSISKYLNHNYSFEFKHALERVNLRQYAPMLYFNLPPSRIQRYNLQQFTSVREMIVKFGSSLSYFIGFNQITQSYPILVYLNDLRFVAMFLGLIINIIITILTLLSTILIYSLLMINVENRTFEMGVLRMIGMHRGGVVQLIIIQAFLYSIPGLLIGLFLGGMIYIGISYLLSFYFDSNELSRLLDYTAVIVSISLGIAIPLLASLLPIRAALGQNLHDSLDTDRSKTKSVEYSIERNSEGSISTTMVVVPGLVVVAGFCVYYFFPLSLLTLNLNFLLSMFFAVLLGMLLGLVVLALNLENMIEKFFTTLLLFWENVAIRQLILKNLVAHRVRNRKTTIMYAMSLGFVIFVAIAFNLQLGNFKHQIVQDYGTRINVRDNFSFDLRDYATQIESFIELYKSGGSRATGLQHAVVNDFTYMTYPLHYYTPYNKDHKIYPKGKFNYGTLTALRAVPPNFMTVTDPFFLMFHTKPSSAIYSSTDVYSPSTISELLYTSKGSQNIILGGSFKDLLSIPNVDHNATVLVEFVTPTSQYPRYDYRLLRPMCFLTNAPYFAFSSFPSSTAQHAIISLASYYRMANGTFRSMGDIPMERLFIDINKNAKESDVSKFKKDLSSYLRYLPLIIKDANDDLGTINVALDATNFLLYFVTILSMIMCFFSLVSSLYTNIQEQTKEIAILRAIGCKKFFMQRLYVYESLILVLSASLIGIVIGFVLGFTMSIQSNLFTELPVSVYVPWELILIVIGVAFVSAFLSAFFPVTSLLRNNIVTLLKRMVT